MSYSVDDPDRRIYEKSDVEKIKKRISSFDISDYEQYKQGLIKSFIVLTCSQAIRNNSQIFSDYMPELSTVIDFYNDMYLLRTKKLAEILEPLVNSEKNSLAPPLLKNTRELFVFMAEIENMDLTKKEVFHELSEKIHDGMSLPEFIENCKIAGEEVLEAESYAIAEDVYQGYIQKFSPIRSGRNEQDRSDIERGI